MSERLQTCQCNKSTTDSLVSNHSKLQDKNRKPLVSRPPLIQTKLTINQPGDEYEQEADRVAEQFMRMPDPSSVPHSLVNSQPERSSIQSITRYPEKDIQRKEEDEEEGIVQMKQVSPSYTAASKSVPPIVHEVLRSPGQLLDPTTRAFMEPRFGHDFSRVRVHDNVSANRAARGQFARAFTVGTHIVFDFGRYESSSTEGKRLLAHELTHVVQQADPVVRRDTSLAHENYAYNAVAEVSQALSVGLQRQPLSEEEIANLQLSDIEARLAANEDESAPLILNESTRDRLVEERRLLIARRDQLSGSTAPGLNAPTKSAVERWRLFHEMLDHIWNITDNVTERMNAFGEWSNYVTTEELRRFLQAEPDTKELYYRWKKWGGFKGKSALAEEGKNTPEESSASATQSEGDLFKMFVDMPQWQKDELTKTFFSISPGHHLSDPETTATQPTGDVGCHTDPHKASRGQSACSARHHKTQDPATLIAEKQLQDPEYLRQIEHHESERRTKLDRLNQAYFHWRATKEYIHRDEFSPYEIENDNIIPVSTRWDIYNGTESNNLEKADFNEHFFRSKEEYTKELKRRGDEYREAFKACKKLSGMESPEPSRYNKPPKDVECRERVQAEYYPVRAAMKRESEWKAKRDIDVGMPAVTDQGFVAALVFHVAHEYLGWSTDEAADLAGFAEGATNIAAARIQKFVMKRQSGGGSSGPDPISPPTTNVEPKLRIEKMPKPDPIRATPANVPTAPSVTPPVVTQNITSPPVTTSKVTSPTTTRSTITTPKYRRPPSTKSRLGIRGHGSRGSRPKSAFAKSLRGGKQTPVPKKRRGGGQGTKVPATTVEPMKPVKSPNPPIAAERSVERTPSESTKAPPKAISPKLQFSNATTTQISELKKQGFLQDKISEDGRSLLFRHPDTGEKVEIQLRQGGPSWLKSNWGRSRIESELRNRGFMLSKPAKGEGGLRYYNKATDEEIRIMPKPKKMHENEPIEKHLNDFYYRYRPSMNKQEGPHTTIMNKDKGGH